MDLRRVGVRVARPLELDEGLLVTLRAIQEAGEKKLRFQHLGLCVERGAHESLGLLVALAIAAQNISGVEEHPRIVALASAVGGDGLVVALLGLQLLAEEDARRHIVGPQLDVATQGLEHFVLRSQLFVHAGEEEQSFGDILGFLEHRLRLFETPGTVEQIPVFESIARVVRRERCGFPGVVERLRGTACRRVERSQRVLDARFLWLLDGSGGEKLERFQKSSLVDECLSPAHGGLLRE